MRRTLIAVMASCLLAVTACTGGGSSTPTASEADVVAWMDKVCGAVDGTVKTMADEPPIDMSDPSKLKTGLSDWLGSKVSVADRSIADLKALENGPHPRSKELATAAQAGMGQVRTLLADTKSKLDSSTDSTQVVTAFTEMVAKAAELENAGADVQKKFDETGLAGAAQKASNCKGLQASPPTP
ncbi:hypothetical protein SAMN04488074_10999 [Lentzea albidocapillata subsp. violacea]|uniref:Small secreted protein n=1 Tax=Lentzea albidocapillata subsp. violacea TaxID=128104 RepID=A0A1G9HM74_9PSEU|nr:hypothetical protein [Lentzea albidocapillata]SDL13623.1 hypothetical protein SAMN04488074_10999 [Lentzea albidocapillata subsp. violacea]